MNILSYKMDSLDSFITYLLCLNRNKNISQTYITNIKIYTYLCIFKHNIFDDDSLQELLSMSTKITINNIINKFIDYNNTSGIIFILKNIDSDIIINVEKLARYVIKLRNNNNILKLLSDKYKKNDPYNMMSYLLAFSIGNEYTVNATSLIKYVDPTFINARFYFKIALSCENIKIIKLLLKQVDNTSTINSWFIDACYVGHIGIIKKFLTNDILDPSYNNNEALLIACIINNKEIVELLTRDSRVNPLDRNYNIILIAIREEHIDIARLLIERSTLVISYDLINYFTDNGHTLIANLLKSML